ncbi:hypothetical protein AJ88_27680 [Mesorhizobium amorphae CCBAU 01583]|nr:hypothetical protein AJ88_27680 [Mesorhizobium amorphae CCBAU 01583]
MARAKAVSFYGPGLFHALNNLALPKDFLKSLRGFNMGGFVDNFSRSLAMPRFAGGGMVPIPAGSGASSGSGKTPLNLNFPGFGSFQVMADDDVAMSLQRVAVKSGLLTTGRKPRRS